MAKLGGKGRHLSPGAASWGHEIEVRILRNISRCYNYNLQNGECQQLLPNCEISSRSPRFSNRAVEVFGLCLFWVRLRSCFANFESESYPDPVPTRFKQSHSSVYKVSMFTTTFRNLSIYWGQHRVLLGKLGPAFIQLVSGSRYC